MIDIQMLLEAFLGDFQTWDYLPYLLKYQDFLECQHLDQRNSTS
jgi:hypothetical protein